MTRCEQCGGQLPPGCRRNRRFCDPCKKLRSRPQHPVRECQACGAELSPRRWKWCERCALDARAARKRVAYANDSVSRARKVARHRERYASDPEYRASRIEHAVRWRKEKSAADPAYRERLKASARRRAAKRIGDPRALERRRLWEREDRARRRRNAREALNVDLEALAEFLDRIEP